MRDMSLLLAAASASRSKARPRLVVPAPVSAMEWDSGSSSIYAVFGPNLLTADGSLNNPVENNTNTRTTTEKDSGKYYVEFLYNRIGASYLPHISVTGAAAYPYRGGFVPFGEANSYGWGFRATGDAYVDSTLLSGYLPAINPGDVGQFIMDFNAGKIWFGVNNTIVGNPAAGTGEASATLPSTVAVGENGGPSKITAGFPATFMASLAYTNGGADYGSVTARFKSTDWTYTPPTGFGEWTP